MKTSYQTHVCKVLRDEYTFWQKQQEEQRREGEATTMSPLYIYGRLTEIEMIAASLSLDIYSDGSRTERTGGGEHE